MSDSGPRTQGALTPVRALPRPAHSAFRHLPPGVRAVGLASVAEGKPAVVTGTPRSHCAGGPVPSAQRAVETPGKGFIVVGRGMTMSPEATRLWRALPNLAVGVSQPFSTSLCSPSSSCTTAL